MDVACLMALFAEGLQVFLHIFKGAMRFAGAVFQMPILPQKGRGFWIEQPSSGNQLSPVADAPARNTSFITW